MCRSKLHAKYNGACPSPNLVPHGAGGLGSCLGKTQDEDREIQTPNLLI